MTKHRDGDLLEVAISCDPLLYFRDNYYWILSSGTQPSGKHNMDHEDKKVKANILDIIRKLENE